jgi:hypothetical protein
VVPTLAPVRVAGVAGRGGGEGALGVVPRDAAVLDPVGRGVRGPVVVEQQQAAGGANVGDVLRAVPMARTATQVLQKVRTRCLTPCNCRQPAGPWDHLWLCAGVCIR